MNIALWILQVLLAAVFGMAGGMKLIVPIAEMAKNPGAAWIAQAPLLVHFIGVSELAGALGMLLPALTRVQPQLTPWAGVGLTVVMILATGFNIHMGMLQVVPMTLILGAMAAFVAWGRFKKVVIRPR